MKAAKIFFDIEANLVFGVCWAGSVCAVHMHVKECAWLQSVTAAATIRHRCDFRHICDGMTTPAAFSYRFLLPLPCLAQTSTDSCVRRGVHYHYKRGHTKKEELDRYHPALRLPSYSSREAYIDTDRLPGGD